MSSFSANQLKQLVKKLDRAKVQTREIEGRNIDYIEGWFAITEANAIFGFGGWDREMAYLERVYEYTRDGKTNCGYIVRIRIRVRAGTSEVVREGSGFGYASAKLVAEAHEHALKSAETDATKRALATFGNRFGLGLYDKEQGGVSGQAKRTEMAENTGVPISDPISDAQHVRNSFELRAEDGTILANHLSAEGFCSGLRQLAEGLQRASDVEALRTHNAASISTLRTRVPGLLNLKGRHYADILEDLLAQRVCRLEDKAPPDAGRLEENQNFVAPSPESGTRSVLTTGPVIDKSALNWGEIRRVRNKAHLAKVSAEPCLICTETPSHAHHITFAQPRGLAIKVSDEFTVPLCAMHHNALHRSRHEEAWWRECAIDPLLAARALWEKTLAGATI